MRRVLPLGTWAAGVVAYLVSITNRTSLSALGVDTAEHFRIDAVTLSLFAVLQLGVYGLCQVPVGVLLDRLGPRTVLTTGIVLLGVAQAAIALSPSVVPAVLARALLGAGDATVFPSVLRLIGMRFPARLAPVFVQATGLIGQLGQLISVVPFALLVRGAGWTPGFLGLAATSVLVAVLVNAVVHEQASGPRAVEPLREQLRAAWAMPSTRSAFWIHAATPFSANAFTVLWGAPYLAAVGGLDQTGVIALLGTSTLVGLVAGPLVGVLSGALPDRRIALALGAVAVQAGTWIVVSAVPPPVPVAVLLVLIGVLGIGGPASMLAFDVVRHHTAPARLSTATGLVNTAGFTSSVVVLLLVGVVLTLAGGDGARASAGAFRLAELVQLPVWAVCAAMIVVTARAAGKGRRVAAAPRDTTVQH